MINVSIPKSPVFSPSSSFSCKSSTESLSSSSPPTFTFRPLVPSVGATSCSSSPSVSKRKRPAKLNIPVGTFGFSGMVSKEKEEDMWKEVQVDGDDGYSVYCKKGKRDVMEDRFKAIVEFNGEQKQLSATITIRISVCATTGTYNQVNPPNRVSNQMAPPGFAPVQNNGQNRKWISSKRQKTKPNVKIELHGMDKDCCKSEPSQKSKVRVNTEESAVKPEPELKNTIGCNLNPSDGPGKPNSIFMKTVKTKWVLNQLQQPICVQLTKTVKTLKAQS
ncbi:probable protein phosphatase 2C 25 [Tanacetum coccineum]|uniref:Probable protein phosphatase 2C 25 n=1 Tax=Tanacetum coccineum TaxID=301880 RepID=A0ABQ5F8T4_9ASTR